MTVRQFLALWVDNISVRVYQEPIIEIDKYEDLVHRQTGSVDVLLNSNQNYLDFKIVNLQDDDGLVIVVCKANEEQERKIVESHKHR